MRQSPFSQRLVQRAHGAAQPPVATGAGVRSGAAVAAGVLWLAAGLTAGYWFLQAKGQGVWTPVQGMAPSVPQADVDTVARALGASVAAESPAAAPAPVARLRLLGVVAQGGQQGAALISVDGQPPRPWRVGAEVAEGLVLQSVGRRIVQLGATRSGPVSLELTVPPQPSEAAPE